MAVTVRDAEDQALAGALEYDDFLTEFEQEWMLPETAVQQALSQEQALLLWKQLPPEMHAAMQAQDARMYAELKRKMTEIEAAGK